MTELPSAEVGLEQTMKIARKQQAVSEAMHFAELAGGICDAACREALVLAASELAENIIKYGVQHQDPNAGTISVSVRDNVVRVRAVNAVASFEDARMVVDTVARISAPASDATQLYRTRLRELYADPAAPRAQLGLLRLAFEAGFRLSASFEAPLLAIVAERPCRSD